ncbi:MAG: hypothetical protein GY816_00885 [Cytophagales bacterium]|nr:hypothetical protein [Cytophagales bacterium]
MKKILIFPIVLLIFSCAANNKGITNIDVKETGTESGGEFCNKFSLSNLQATELIKASREVEINEFHNNYEYLPCFVKGSLNMGVKECNFTIRAGGTVEITCTDNTGYIFVCDSCEHLLIDNE